jgi:hypothetical protein
MRISRRLHGVKSQDSILQIHRREKPKFMFTAELSKILQKTKLKNGVRCCTGNLNTVNFYWMSRDSSVGIATRYGLEGPGIESRWGEIFRTYPDRLRGPPNLLYNGYRVFPGRKGGRGVMLITHPLLVPRLRKS